mgnify:CR=1 FL=1
MSRTHNLGTARAASAVAATCAAVLPLSSCFAPQPLPAEDAVAHYEQVRVDLITAIGAEDLGLEVREEPVVETADGTCVYDPGSWEADGEFVANAESAWGPLIDPLNEVLGRHGFGEVDEFTYANGEAFGISVVDGHGLRLRAYTLEGSTIVSLHGAVIDAEGRCSLAELGV